MIQHNNIIAGLISYPYHINFVFLYHFVKNLFTQTGPYKKYCQGEFIWMDKLYLTTESKDKPHVSMTISMPAKKKFFS